MTDELPHDADGDALRRLIATGSDLSREMNIDFSMAVPDFQSGQKFASAANAAGFQAVVHRDEVTGDWTCYCSLAMTPSYEAIVTIQKNLAELGRPFSARPDGWGSFGNAAE